MYSLDELKRVIRGMNRDLNEEKGVAMGKYAEYCTDVEHYGLIKIKVKEYLTLEEAQHLFEELDEALCQAESDKLPEGEEE